MYQILAYFQFLVQWITQKNKKTPFVSEFKQHCLANTKTQKELTILDDYRNALYNNNSTISITDFGAGSRVFKSNTRKISSIAKTAGITKKRAQLLYKLTSHYQFENILELGTSLGIATSAFSLGNPNANITTIEGCPETAKVAQQQFDVFQLNNITLKVNNFNDELQHLEHQKFDCIYIDGNHQKDPTLQYFNTLLNHTNENSILIFDDIHWSKDMTEAWNSIKQHKKVTLTIDTFFWGFVFFKKETKRNICLLF